MLLHGAGVSIGHVGTGDWITFLQGLFVAGIGLAAKDHDVTAVQYSNKPMSGRGAKMWTWLPQSWAGWVLLSCFSAAWLFAVYEVTSLSLRRPYMESTKKSLSSLTVIGGKDLKTTNKKKKAIS